MIRKQARTGDEAERLDTYFDETLLVPSKESEEDGSFRVLSREAREGKECHQFLCCLVSSVVRVEASSDSNDDKSYKIDDRANGWHDDRRRASEEGREQERNAL